MAVRLLMVPCFLNGGVCVLNGVLCVNGGLFVNGLCLLMVSWLLMVFC